MRSLERAGQQGRSGEGGPGVLRSGGSVPPRGALPPGRIHRGRPARARRIGGLAAALVGDATASAAIEFAMLGMCVVGLVLEVLQAGLYGYQTAALERAAYQASRMIKVGTASSHGLTGTAFKTSLCALLPSGMSCARVIASVRNATEGTAPGGFYAFVKADQSGIVQPTMDAGTTTFCPGGPSSFVYLQVYYAMPAFSPTWRAVGSTMWQGSPVHFLTAQSVFRNEPYASSGSGC